MGRKIIIGIAALFILVNITIVLIVVLRGSSSPPPPALPNPNGYDDFVLGASKVNGNVSGFASMDRDQLAKLVSNNADALKLLGAGLGKECRVPVDYSTNYLNTLTPQVSSFKNAATLFAAAGRLAELEGRTNDAARSYLDGIRFGQEQFRGGVAMSRLVGVACEAIAARRLETLAGNLDATNSAFVATTLDSIDAREEPAAETIKQEKYWSKQTAGLQGRIAMVFMAKSMQKTMDTIAAKWDANTLHRRRMILESAARAYELDKGKPPQNAADLVPAYLKAVPKDPVTGQDLRVGR